MTRRIFFLLVSLVFFVVDRTACWFRRLRRQSCSRFTVLYYHEVTERTRARFAAQMDYVQRRCIPARIGSVSQGDDRRPAVVVTFDDAFESVFENALPELEKRGIPATVFVVSGCLGQSPRWWTDPEHAPRDERVIGADALRRCDRELVTVGSHSVTHPHLVDIPADRLDEELRASKEQLELLLGREVADISFPFGDYNAEVIRAAKDAGYRRAFANLPDFRPLSRDGFVVRRVRVSPDDWPLEFRLKIAGAYRWHYAAACVRRRVRVWCPGGLSGKV